MQLQIHISINTGIQFHILIHIRTGEITNNPPHHLFPLRISHSLTLTLIFTQEKIIYNPPHHLYPLRIPHSLTLIFTKEKIIYNPPHELFHVRMSHNEAELTLLLQKKTGVWNFPNETLIIGKLHPNNSYG